jgi:hypothetical protein
MMRRKVRKYSKFFIYEKLIDYVEKIQEWKSVLKSVVKIGNRGFVEISHGANLGKLNRLTLLSSGIDSYVYAFSPYEL